MVGRALPEPLAWNSVPPADSLSVLWGGGACTVTDAARSVALDPAHALLAVAALLERFDEPLPIAAFSALARQSPPEFSRFFRRAWGLAPTQFRKQLRLLHGTRALVEGRSVTRAALDAGFADTAHFTRTFRERYGEAPSARARAVRAGAA